MKLSKGIQFFAGNTQTTYDLTNLNLSAGNYAITVIAEAEGFTDSDASNSVNYTVQAQLAAPTIAMNADGKTLEITDVANATSYDVYVDGALKTNVAKTPTAILELVAGDLYGPTFYSIYYEINGKVTSNSSQTGSGSVNIELAPNDYVDVAATSYDHRFREDPSNGNKVYWTFGKDIPVVKTDYSLNGDVYRISNMTTNGTVKFWVYA